MPESHATAWALEAPTLAQMKELFAQIDSGRVTKERLQLFLGEPKSPSFRMIAIEPGDEYELIVTGHVFSTRHYRIIIRTPIDPAKNQYLVKFEMPCGENDSEVMEVVRQLSGLDLVHKPESPTGGAHYFRYVFVERKKSAVAT